MTDPDASTVVPDLQSALNLVLRVKREVREQPQRAAATAPKYLASIDLLLRRCLSVLDTKAERGVPGG